MHIQPRRWTCLASETQFDSDVCDSLCVWMCHQHTKAKSSWASEQIHADLSENAQQDGPWDASRGIFHVVVDELWTCCLAQNKAIKRAARPHTTKNTRAIILDASWCDKIAYLSILEKMPYQIRFWNTSVVSDWTHTLRVMAMNCR